MKFGFGPNFDSQTSIQERLEWSTTTFFKFIIAESEPRKLQ